MFLPITTAEWAATPTGTSPLVRTLSHIMFPSNRHENIYLEPLEGNKSQKGNAIETHLCPVCTYRYGICLQTRLHECRFLDPLQRWRGRASVGVVSPVFLAGTSWKWLSQDHIKTLLRLQISSGLSFCLKKWCRWLAHKSFFNQTELSQQRPV